MNYRRLGKTGLMVSEIGFGGEWLERHTEEEGIELIRYAAKQGINVIDCWMADPKSRDIIGRGMKGEREKWFVHGHIGSTWRDGQYFRSRDLEYVIPAFEDLLTRLDTDYIDLGMIHYVDSMDEWKSLQGSPYLEYIFELKRTGKIRHIGMSSHNPVVAAEAARSGFVEMMLFSVNPAFDLMPPSEDLDATFKNIADGVLGGVTPERDAFYRVCEQNDVGITVMKGYAGGRLLKADTSPFGVALTPVRCIHYALTRPAAASVLCGYDSPDQIDAAMKYETATDEEKDYAAVLATAPKNAIAGKCMYCNHCKPCPMDIDIAMVSKLYDLAMMQPEVPESLREHYRGLPHNADECIGCGSCEQRCPFGVKIAERMAAARELFA